MWEAFWLIEAARIRIAAGTPEEALERCLSSASLHRQIGDRSREATALDCAGEAIGALGRPEEAMAFHLQASRAHGDLGDTWRKAVALVHVADCLSNLGRHSDKRRYLAEALELLRAFPDQLAVTLAEDVSARLTGPPPAPTT